MIASLTAHATEIAALCRRYHVRRLDVFGSAARGTDFDPARSDLDLLVEYEPGQSPPSLTDFFALRDALEALCGRRVELVMPGGLRNPYVRASIERSRTPLYAA